ncbi:hypothetical protein ACIBH1_32040 [Nonomuraea sp. NPDC050663]|uniref:Spy/CpxP family protein refolding chaperone n=1 Tax=Nonomuraea soli TaxID=1032476 RepID=A0A7W0HUI9_9ACTN|nr:hypothetical protein [Nonomuraea soli]MBA2895856.1 Spy/CpxP family protein refolding chaperone [Nonomuraea soli]NUT41784.1 hypothetical protein [Thermoactinospora sp.]
MFNIKRAVAAAALSAAMAGGALTLTTTSASAATQGVTASPMTMGPSCIWINKGSKLKVRKGERYNRLNVRYNFDTDTYHWKRVRGCAKVSRHSW